MLSPVSIVLPCFIHANCHFRTFSNHRPNYSNRYKKVLFNADDPIGEHYAEFQFSLCDIEEIVEALKNAIDYQNRLSRNSSFPEKDSDTTIKNLQKLSNVFKKLCDAKVKEEYKNFDIYFFH